MRVAIVGGGIGGMSLALSLVAAGLDDIDIYESAAAIRELGVGINVLPHAIRELTELGLLEQLLGVGIPTGDFAYFSRLGQRIWTEPLGRAAGYRWPQLSIHRGQLLAVLAQAVAGRLGADRIHTGHHLVRIGKDANGPWAEFVDRTIGAPVNRVEADLLVGCDGIHSVVRRSLYPHEGPPKWNGVTMWRGTTLGKPYLSGRTMINAGSTRQRVVVYPISKVAEEQGRALINWVATRRAEVEGGAPAQDWTYIAQPEEVLAAFAGFVFNFLDVPALIAGSEVVYRYPMMEDRKSVV